MFIFDSTMNALNEAVAVRVLFISGKADLSLGILIELLVTN